MLDSYLIKGILVGLVFGVPAGAIGALTIQRTMERGFWSGFVTGLGSSAADMLYACIGVFGITIISDFLLTHQTAISLIGSVFILLLGIAIFRKEGKVQNEEKTINKYPAFFASSFAIGIMNPATILSFIVAFSSFGIAVISSAAQGAQLIAGILIGTGSWWAALSGLVCLFQSRITDGIYQKLNRVLGCLMMVFAIYIGVRALLR